MKSSELLQVLDEQDTRHRIWLFTPAMLRALFEGETDQSMEKSLRRHSHSGLLRQVNRRLYANERARSMPRHARLEALVPYLRPRELNYVSQESRLAELGVISQMPGAHLTMMTTGRSQVFTTAYGTIEFTHTTRDPGELLRRLTPQAGTGLLVADVATAYRDLKATGRNLEMIDEEELQELLSEHTEVAA